MGRREPKQLNLIVWNIAGVTRLEEMTDLLDEYSIIILQETWVEEKAIGGVISRLSDKYEWSSKMASREKGRGRAKGGQLVGIKKEDLKMKVTEWKYGLILEGDIGGRELRIISVYNNEGMRETKKEIEALILETVKKSQRLLIVGDWNARIGKEQGSGLQDDEEEWSRNSEDQTLNTEGRKLLDLCVDYGLTVLNGRTRGDRIGHLTYIGPIGASVLDYIIIKEEDETEELIESIKVLPRTESDHLPVEVTFATELEDNEGNSDEVRRVEESLCWKETKSERYEEMMIEMWKTVKKSGTSDERMAELIECVKEAAKRSGMTKKPTKRRGQAWFDEECRESRRIVWKALTKYIKSKKMVDRQTLCKEKTKLKLQYERKKSQYWEERWKSVEQSKTIKDFWSAIRTFRPRKKVSGRGIKAEEWLEHFKKLLGGSESSERETTWLDEVGAEDEEENQANQQNELNRDIETVEIIKAMKKMKRNKAPGEDGVRVEFLRGMHPEAVQEWGQIVSDIWKEGKIPENWRIARICPIFKAGAEDEAANYRGISLLDVGYKILTTVMAERLRGWLETHKKLEESQNGFRAGRSTRDHIFVLNSLIGNKLKMKGGKLYVAFVDFKAAFDMVDRDLLMRKLRRIGVTGRMLKMIGNIYEKTLNTVIIQGGCTEEFQTMRGVRQGCPLSPTLFNVFIDDLDVELRRRNEGGTVLGLTKIYTLKFADDVALVADNEKELNHMLKTLERYVKRNRMQVNTAKTKVMVFRKGGRRSKKEKWTYGNEEIEEVGAYKYLGFWFTVKNSYSAQLKALAAKAQVATNAAWGIMKRARLGGLKRKGYLLDTMVRTILTYAAEIWGWKERTEIERVAGRYVKMMLGVNRCTPAYIWRMEAGRRKTEVDTRRRAGEYLITILKMPDGRLPKVCLKEELRNWANGNGTRWCLELEAAMTKVGFGRILERMRTEDNLEGVATQLEQGCKIVEDQTIQNDWCRIDNSKYCAEYKRRKDKVGVEKYWSQRGTSEKDKVQWARMRCGNIGRAGNKGYVEESCRLCGQGKEKLEHISQCVKFQEIVDRKIKEEAEKLLGDRDGTDEWNVVLTKEVNRILCDYCRAYETALREMSKPDEV